MPARKNDPRNTVQSTLAAHKAASARPVLEWPADVALPSGKGDRAKELFGGYLSGRNPSHWRPFHARIIADLVRLDLQIEKMMSILDSDGPLAPSNNNPNVLVRNPALDGLSMLMSLRTSGLKQLGLTGSHFESDGQAKGINEAKIVQNRAREADGLLAGDDGLLA